MGQEIECVCRDCKKKYDIGRSRNWKETPDYHKFSELHLGHNTVCYSTDFVRKRGKDLVHDHPYLEESELTMFIENYSEYVNDNL